tara:strand:+ start:219 stop:878 length:660 start_codon:yes stop_codon:yes gene_type:complete
MRNNRKTYAGGQVPQFDNVVNLFAPRGPIDPMLDEYLIQCCRDFFSRGDVAVNGIMTEAQEKLTAQDLLDYGLHAPMLVIRSPQTMDAFDEIYVNCMTDGRFARCMQIIFTAYINHKTLTRDLLAGLISSHAKRLTELTGTTTDNVIDKLVRCDLCKEVNGIITCTRRCAYFIIESIGFLLDRMRGFSKTHFPEMSKNWGSDGNTCWLDINSPLEHAHE